jgi:outer membrane beta-barrel protein
MWIVLNILMALQAPASEGGNTVTPETLASETAAAPSAPKNDPEAVDISDLEEDYWRPNRDELEVVQNRKYEKKGRFELGLHFGIYQGQDYVDAKSLGGSLTYNFTNHWFAEASHHNISNSDNDFLTSVQQRFGFTPDFNREESQSILSVGWVPIYAKFSLLGKKISHFEMYGAPGIGITKTKSNRTSGHFTLGQKFFLTESFLFRLEWRMSRYSDRISTPQGATSIANGGPGFVDRTATTHNIIFGLGWMF